MFKVSRICRKSKANNDISNYLETHLIYLKWQIILYAWQNKFNNYTVTLFNTIIYHMIIVLITEN